MHEQSLLGVNRREIWTGDASAVRELIAGALTTLLLSSAGDRPVYVAAPVLTDFPIFHNEFGEFSGLFPDLADQAVIRLGDVLLRLGQQRSLRLIGRSDERTLAFVETYLPQAGTIEYALSDRPYPEEGLLAPSFYLEGGLDFDAQGVRTRGEKVSYYTALTPDGKQRIANAYLEFERRWTSLRGTQ
jgi:hypothetical protein